MGYKEVIHEFWQSGRYILQLKDLLSTGISIILIKMDRTFELFLFKKNEIQILTIHFNENVCYNERK